ncbi:MAG: extracellular solute-binding protein [Chloroflexi bacterium]|nr:extracellular solute-binding protein [Chloroflexota bacterium]
MRRDELRSRRVIAPWSWHAISTLVLTLVLAACAPAAPPPPTPTSAPKPAAATPAPAATKAAPAPAAATAAPAPSKATPAAKGPSAALAQVIEGTKREGRVQAMLQTGMVGEPVKEIQQGIKAKYGVDLQIDAVPSQSYPVALSAAIAEHKAGVEPSLDIIPLGVLQAVDAIKAGIAEKVDWAPLLREGTPKEVIQQDGYAVVTFMSHSGLAYNPKVIAPSEVPKSFTDLANPKWKGKLAMYSYPVTYVTYAYALGADKFISTLREIAKNNPVVEPYAQGETRFTAGEYPLLVTQSSTLVSVRNKGIQAEWVSLDISYIQKHNMIVRKGTKRPNAAKLLTVFLASPEGHKIYNKTGRGTMFYPGNFEFEVHDRDVKAGMKVYAQDDPPDIVSFFLSDKGKQLEKEIGDILQQK